jgi:hypothetical protein|tara:strand:- start:331 stop:741 length:411 start_codon:yes stop_codon:yes gene_type:complete
MSYKEKFLREENEEDKPKEKRKSRGNPSFHKGMTSINPAGRPKGSLNKYTKLSRELMSEKGPELVEKVIELALEGDRHCLKMCLDRIIPVSKAVEIKHEHEDLGINIIIESVKAIERQEEKDYKLIEGDILENMSD